MTPMWNTLSWVVVVVVVVTTVAVAVPAVC
jgi:hypothetical protein